jgi:hypothetical protein
LAYLLFDSGILQNWSPHLSHREVPCWAVRAITGAAAAAKGQARAEPGGPGSVARLPPANMLLYTRLALPVKNKKKSFFSNLNIAK